MATKSRHARSEKSIIGVNEDTVYGSHARKMEGSHHAAGKSFRNRGLADELGDKLHVGRAVMTAPMMQADIPEPVCDVIPPDQPLADLPALTEWEKYEYARRFVCSNHVFVDVDVHPNRYKDVCASLGLEAVHCNKLSSKQLNKCLKGCGAECSSCYCECLTLPSSCSTSASTSSCSSSDSSSSCSSSDSFDGSVCASSLFWIKNSNANVLCKKHDPCCHRYIRIMNFDDVVTLKGGSSNFNPIQQKYHSLKFTNTSVFNPTNETNPREGDLISVVSQPNFLRQFDPEKDWTISRKKPFSLYSMLLTLTIDSDDAPVVDTLNITGILKGKIVAYKSVKINIFRPSLFEPKETDGFRNVDKIIFERLGQEYSLIANSDNIVVGL